MGSRLRLVRAFSLNYLFYVDGRNLIRCITLQNRKTRDMKEIVKGIRNCKNKSKSLMFLFGNDYYL